MQLSERCALLSTLDGARIAAVKAALTQKVTLIQGPPGTGKTHVGLQIVRVILANTKHKDAAARPGAAGEVPEDDDDNRGADKPVVGPLICLCFTNHALDQFRTELQRVEITNIVRIGGGCKKPELEACGLRTLSKATVTGNRTDKHLAGLI